MSSFPSLPINVALNCEHIQKHLCFLTTNLEMCCQRKGEMSRRPSLRFTSPHIFNLLIFPLDTAKNYRLNSIVHQFYWQRLFMQLTAHYLSHTLLTSILICERERWMTEGREGWTDRVREITEWYDKQGDRDNPSEENKRLTKEGDNLSLSW